jgi:hypothetical protein
MASGRWQPQTIKRYIESIPTSTRVARVETDAGEGFLKAMGNPEGPHVLACELVGTLLAEWLGLATLDSAIIWVGSDDEIEFAGGGMAAPGPAFITRAETGMAWGGDAPTLRKLLNPGDISRLIVLDTWIRNCDRYRPEPNRRVNRDNVFLTWSSNQRKGLTLKAIDHTHAFTCGRELTRRLSQLDDVRDKTLFGTFPEFFPFLRREDVSDCAGRLGTMNTTEATKVVDKIPGEWQVEESIRLAWIKLICDRAKFVSEHIVSWLWAVGPRDDVR